jgi:hypothetical protein
MALALYQVVRVRVAVVLDTTDLSVGQVYDEASGSWADLVWVDLAGSTVLPQEFGNAEYWAEVSNLALTRSGTVRPAVKLRAWCAGGVVADGYTIRTTGSVWSNIASLQRGGADVTTDLPGLGPVQNLVRIHGHRDQRVGWTGRLPVALSWERTYLAIRKRVKYDPASSTDAEHLSCVSGFAGDLAGFNTWLATNQPEYGSALTIGTSLEFARNLVSGPRTTWNRYLAVFTLHAYLNTDYATWGWTTRGGLISLQTVDGSYTFCGGIGATAFQGDTYATTSANAAFSRWSAHYLGTPSGSFATPVAGGGTVTATPRGTIPGAGPPSYGVNVSLTVSPQGRITGVVVSGFSSDGAVIRVGGWGACKTEGGLLA